MRGGADWSRTCKGCAHIVNEPGPKGAICIVAEKEGRAFRKVADLSEWWRGQKHIKILDPNLLACREHMDLLGQLAESGAWVDFTQGLGYQV